MRNIVMNKTRHLLLHLCSFNKANKYSAAEVSLMRSQDMNYLNLKRQVESEVGSQVLCCFCKFYSSRFPKLESLFYYDL